MRRRSVRRLFNLRIGLNHTPTNIDSRNSQYGSRFQELIAFRINFLKALLSLGHQASN